MKHVVRTLAELFEEAHQIENLIRSVEHSLADQHTSLGEAMRLCNWRKRLDAYLEGIRFALGDTKKSFAAIDSADA